VLRIGMQFVKWSDEKMWWLGWEGIFWAHVVDCSGIIGTKEGRGLSLWESLLLRCCPRRKMLYRWGETRRVTKGYQRYLEN